MERLEDVVRNPARLHEQGVDLVRELCDRDGAVKLVETVTALVNARTAERYIAIRFLREGIELPDLAAAINGSGALADSLAGLLASSNLRDRLLAISAFGHLPIALAAQRLTSAAPVTWAERDIISLSNILQWVEIPEVVSTLAADDDWLVRWALSPYANFGQHSALANRIRAQLAVDPNPFVAREAALMAAFLDDLEKKAIAQDGWTFGTPPIAAVSFSQMAEDFIESWAVDKDTYSVEEFRAFIEQTTNGT